MAGGMKLGELLEGLEQYREEGLLRSQHKAVVRALACDSRVVRPGSVFVAVKGPRVDGHDYIS
ncbi:UDP-N-acetylmuramoyl-tripeptide--D-alanyl-D-alanine ligase, partial [bacterium]|nr:UDP-N-acetylmuramoyl-tripeptide--D-alanyl-D-alanine ligase [bacterium]